MGEHHRVQEYLASCHQTVLLSGCLGAVHSLAIALSIWSAVVNLVLTW